MLDDERTTDPTDGSPVEAAPPAPAEEAPRPRRRRATKTTAAAGTRPADGDAAAAAAGETPPADESPAGVTVAGEIPAAEVPTGESAGGDPAAAPAPTRARRTRRSAASAAAEPAAGDAAPHAEAALGGTTPGDGASAPEAAASAAEPAAADAALGTAAEPTEPAPTEPAPTGRRRRPAIVVPTFLPPDPTALAPAVAADADDEGETAEEAPPAARRRRRSKRDVAAEAAIESADEAEVEQAVDPDAESDDDGDDAGDDEDRPGRRRRRRRRRRSSGAAGDDDAAPEDDGVEVVTHVREPRQRRSRERDPDDEVRGVQGSTRLEARKQRRREGRDSGRKRVPIITESEFLARRESVERVMLVRATKERIQIAVLEDGVLVEHYVSHEANSTSVGNVYLGRVQNVLPSMEAAFVDIGKGRNAVLYAGEVNWDAAGLEGQPRRIEAALKPGQPVLVQVSKDPIGQKGSRLTSQISLPGRFVALVPDGGMTGISRKLPDTERTRLKALLKAVVPEGAGVIVRTAAEGASEEELTRDIARLSAQWDDIKAKAEKGDAPALLYAEPDLTLRVIRDVFNEDFAQLVVQGDDEWDMVEAYLGHVAPDLAARAQRYTGTGDVFHDHRVDEQLAKALDRKVWLPSGGSLVIDRTEAMTVVDVNTGKFVGQGGNLEETVTRNNLEAAEEIVRQLRLRDIGGIIVVDFIDMVLESNRDLVLRRLVECLGRDRTRHNVAEVTSLGLVQMTRKRVGQGLLEAFSTPCEHCHGRGLTIHLDGPPPRQRHHDGARGENGRSGGDGGRGDGGRGEGGRGGGRREGRRGRDRDRDAAPETSRDAGETAAASRGVDDSPAQPAPAAAEPTQAAPTRTSASVAEPSPSGPTATSAGSDGAASDAAPRERRRRRAVRPSPVEAPSAEASTG